MALCGSLLDFSITDVLQLIKMQSKSGALRLSSRDQEVMIWFQGGDVIYAEDPARPVVKRVGWRLVRDGSITKRDWKEARSQQEKSGEPVGRLLAARGLLAEAAVTELTTHYAGEAVFEVFRWREGDYTFDAEAHLPVFPTPLARPINSEELLMDGTVHGDEWRRIADIIPGMTAIFAGKPGSNGPEPEGTVAEALTWVDGRRDVYEIADCMRQGVLACSQALATLAAQGQIGLIGESARPQAAADDADQPDGKRQASSRPVVVEKRTLPWWRAVAVGGVCSLAVFLCGWLVYTGRDLPEHGVEEGLSASTIAYRDYQVRQALTAYRLVHGAYPESLEVLFQDGILADEVVPAGLRYTKNQDGYTLVVG